MSKLSSAGTSTEAAGRALEQLAEMCVDLRAAAIVGAGGELLAASGEGDWAGAAGTLWRAVERDGGEGATQVHVGGEDGEVFAIRSAGLSAVAVTNRFTLESLMFCDLRAILRDLARPPAGEDG